MEVFDNPFVSFFKQCVTYCLILDPKQSKDMNPEEIEKEKKKQMKRN